MDFRLTSSQLNFYTKNITLDSTLWNQSVLQEFPQVYTYEQLNDAYNRLVKANDSIRVKFKETDDGIVTYVEDFEYTDYPLVKVDSEEELMVKAREFLNSTMDFYGRLINCIIFQTPTTSGVMICAHHIVVDGFSGFVMSKQINDFLQNPDYVPSTEKYSDYIEKEEKHKNSKRFLRDKEFWKNQFDTNPVCDIFTAQNSKLDFSSSELMYPFPSALYERIKNFCSKNDISIASFFNTVYATYINRKYDIENFTIGVPVLNRTTQTELNTVGLYMHIVPLVVNLQADSFLANAQRIQDSWMDVFRHQKFTQYDIREMLKEEKKPINTLFDVTADVLEFEPNNDYKIILPYSENLSIPLEFHLQCFNNEERNLVICYRTSLFNEQEIQNMQTSIIALIEDAVENPHKNIYELEMVSAEAKQKLLYDFNNTYAYYEREKTVLNLFEEQVERTPEKIALVAIDKKLTYKTLNEEVNKVAHSLIERGIGKGDIVGVKLSRNSSFLVSLLGVLKAGAAYLPLDPGHPKERLENVLLDSNAKLCITEENIEELLNNTNTENTDVKILGDDVCYCIYTSGSTGQPKGALICHKNLMWYMSSLMSIYGKSGACMPFFTSQSVDLSVTSIFLPLMTGGTTYFYDNDLLNDLSDIFDNEELNIIKLTPTHMQIIQQHINAKKITNLKHLIVGGEQLYRSTCIDFLAKFGAHIKIHNEYGPTETTVGCGDYVFSYDDTDSAVSIGHPTNNVQMYIVDKNTNLLPIGLTGELCIAGDGVCAGYLNRPELTTEKFIDNPFGTGKLYKTGDLAYWRNDGQIIYVGRNDFQVKINGQRIELGEIENAIVEIDGVVQCAVVVREQYICAFYTGAGTDAKDFRTILSTKLPRYMVPHIFTHLDSLPMTVSGKLDRKALPPIDFSSISQETEYVAPTTEAEKALTEVVCSILRIDSINMLDNFFNIGGDSISSIYVVSELEEMGYELHVADIMQSDTLLDVAKAMKSTSNKANYDQGEVNGFIPFSPIMRAFLNENNTIPKDFVHTCIISTDCDEDIARKSLDALVSHHDILRGTFTDNGIEIYPSDEREVYSFNSITIEDTEKAKEYLNNNTKIDDEKLVSVVFCKTEKENLVKFIIHHFLIDLISWEILMEDFKAVVEQLKNNNEISLPAKTASFMMWSDELKKYSETMSEENKEYWNNINKRLDNAKSLYTTEEVNEAEDFTFSFDKDISDKLINEVNTAYGTRINEVLLTALGLAAGKIAEGDVGITVESHGRTELHKSIALEHTIGWFTSCYPVVINNNDNATEELINTKETLRRIPKNGIDYLLLSEGFHKSTDIIFNFYKNSIADGNRENQLIAFSGNSVFPGKINVDCFVIGNTLTVNISVPKCKHKNQISEELGMEFKKQIEKIVDICTTTDTVIKTRSDFSDDELTESELDELKDLFDWTDDDE